MGRATTAHKRGGGQYVADVVKFTAPIHEIISYSRTQRSCLLEDLIVCDDGVREVTLAPKTQALLPHTRKRHLKGSMHENLSQR